MILEKSLPIFVQRYPPPPSSLLTSDPALPTYDSGEEFATLCAAIPPATPLLSCDKVPGLPTYDSGEEFDTLCAAIPATLLPFDQVPGQIQRLLPGHQLAT